MLARGINRSSKRRGAAAVESALVLGIFFVLLFGVFEYCRFLMVLHVTNNAARDASRYATVNVANDQMTKDAILQYAKDRMGGTERNVKDFAVDAYPCTAAGVAKPGNPPWNAASFTERIAVTITGRYEPVTPIMLFLPDSIPIRITAAAGSEG
jgi:Flp pilus assembly protein TadG